LIRELLSIDSLILPRFTIDNPNCTMHAIGWPSSSTNWHKRWPSPPDFAQTKRPALLCVHFAKTIDHVAND
jgi:hypothetical protein